MMQQNNGNDLFTEQQTADVFDSMAEEYDDLKDLWYSWLFLQLHLSIVKYLKNVDKENLKTCLDVGCGTGLQSLLFSSCGINVHGIDISEGLIRIAQKKEPKSYVIGQEFSGSPYKFAKQYIKKIIHEVNTIRGVSDIGSVSFRVASATSIPFHSNTFDIINCCGSTLNFINNYEIALSEINRVLKTGGLLILEVDNKYNFDLIWPVIDYLVGGKLGYDQDISVSISNLFSKPVNHSSISFPFSMQHKETEFKMWLFSSIGLKHVLRKMNLIPVEMKAIHFLTNLIPSTILDSMEPSLSTQKIFQILAKIDPHLCRLPLINSFGVSTVYFCRKGL